MTAQVMLAIGVIHMLFMVMLLCVGVAALRLKEYVATVIAFIVAGLPAYKAYIALTAWLTL